MLGCVCECVRVCEGVCVCVCVCQLFVRRISLLVRRNVTIYVSNYSLSLPFTKGGLWHDGFEIYL